MEKSAVKNKLKKSVTKAIPKALKTSFWLLKLMIPISLGVTLFEYFGLMQYLSLWLTPIFKYLGLHGESVVVFVTSCFLSIYAAIAVLGTMTLDMREITILAMMCLISHNLIIETAIQKKTGSSAIGILLVRIFSSLITAVILNLILPPFDATGIKNIPIAIDHSFYGVMINWLKTSLWLVMKIIILISLLMILQNLLEEFSILPVLSKLLRPLMVLFGLPAETSFTWIVANVIGLTYGSAIMIEEVETGKISKRSADLLNHHVAISHSLLEDTLLFAAIGVSAFWITIPRILFAMTVVWLYKAYLALFRKS